MKTTYNYTWCTIAGAILLALLFPLVSLAETVVRTGDSVSIGVNQVVENDFYAAGGSVTHSGEIKEDIYVVAGSVTMNGQIGVDLTAAGGTVQVNSKVGDDVRVVAGEVIISGEVGGDVFVIGGLLKILSSATVNGDVYFYGGEAEIEGVVTGALRGSAESFTVNSMIGEVDVSSVQLVLGESANIRGDLSYSSVRDIERATGAVIGGEVIRGASPATDEGRGNASLFFMFSWIFTALCFFLLLRSALEELLSDIKNDPARTGLIGLAVTLGAPILSFVLLATVLGAWVGIILFLLTALFFLSSLILMPILLGGYISGFLFSHRRLDVYSVAIGVVAIILATYIPFIGGLLLAAVFLIVVGSLAQVLYKKVKGVV